MNIKELSNYYYLDKELKLLEKQLGDIKQNPMFKSNKKMKEEIISEIVKKQNDCINERVRLEKYINSITDSKTRYIAKLRFVEFKSWYDIADLVTPKEKDTVNRTSPYNTLNRYLKKNN